MNAILPLDEFLILSLPSQKPFKNCKSSYETLKKTLKKTQKTIKNSQKPSKTLKN
jgi:hypothetical protein